MPGRRSQLKRRRARARRWAQRSRRPPAVAAAAPEPEVWRTISDEFWQGVARNAPVQLDEPPDPPPAPPPQSGVVGPLDPLPQLGVTGVSWNRARGKWLASFRHQGRSVHVGQFDSLPEAKTALDAARAELGLPPLPAAAPEPEPDPPPAPPPAPRPRGRPRGRPPTKPGSPPPPTARQRIEVALRINPARPNPDFSRNVACGGV
jgi:hypothetical protein